MHAENASGAGKAESRAQPASRSLICRLHAQRSHFHLFDKRRAGRDDRAGFEATTSRPPTSKDIVDAHFESVPRSLFGRRGARPGRSGLHRLDAW